MKSKAHDSEDCDPLYRGAQYIARANLRDSNPTALIRCCVKRRLPQKVLSYRANGWTVDSDSLG